MVRMSAEERRESVIRAATTEFARGGYHGTSTEAIAKRVGVSQPYLFRLFPGKQAIFLAAAERCVEDTSGCSLRRPTGWRVRRPGMPWRGRTSGLIVRTSPSSC